MPRVQPSRITSAGRYLKRARESRGLGLRECARMVGVSPSRWVQMESGECPSVETAISIVHELKLSVSETQLLKNRWLERWDALDQMASNIVHSQEVEGAK